MRIVIFFSALLIAGLVSSQLLPGWLGDTYSVVQEAIRLLTMLGLAFIMIHVGFEFEIDKRNLRQYGWDYVVAATAAAFPWIFCCLYFMFVMLPASALGSGDAWKESLLASRFSAPTSAGVLFSMLAAAGLSGSWLFKKARVLAIFDDLDTVLLMIPLKMAIVGFRVQLLVVVVIMAVLLWLAWRYLHNVRLPVTWPYVMLYAFGVVLFCEVFYHGSKWIDPSLPIHLEGLLPAFVWGCMLARRPGEDPHADDTVEGHLEGPAEETEQRVATIISAAFMLLVGLSMPVFIGAPAVTHAASGLPSKLTELTPPMSAVQIAMHVLAITLLSNLGKMFCALCYRREASGRERLALAIGMWPRGEVGAGVLVLSLSYAIGGPIVITAMLSLALNLVLTGFFITLIKRLLAPRTALSDAIAE